MASHCRLLDRIMRAQLILALVLVMSALAGCSQIEGMRSAPYSATLTRGEKFLEDSVREKRPPDAAIKEFDKAIASDRNNIDVYLQVMDICRKWGKLDLVAKYGELANAATSNAPPEKRAAMLRLAGDAYLQMGDAAKAVEFNEPALKLRPDDPALMNDLGYSYAELYDAKQAGAVAKLEQALNLTRTAVDKARADGVPDHDLGLFVDSLGWVYYKLEKYDEAAANLTRAVDLAPDVKEIHLHLGRARFAQGRIDDARLEAEKALKIDSGYAPAIDLVNKCKKRPGAEAGAARQNQAPSGQDAMMRADPDATP